MICARKDCAEEGTHHPVLLLRPLAMPEYTGPPAEMILGVLVCGPHQADTKVEDLVADDGWDQIIHVFEAVHRAEPDRSNIGIVWKRPGLSGFPEPTS